MTVQSIVPDGDGNLITLDFSDEVKEGTPEGKCVTTARYVGDAQAYVPILADDYRRNNQTLFPVEAMVAAHEMMMEGV